MRVGKFGKNELNSFIVKKYLKLFLCPISQKIFAVHVELVSLNIIIYLAELPFNLLIPEDVN